MTTITCNFVCWKATMNCMQASTIPWQPPDPPAKGDTGPQSILSITLLLSWTCFQLWSSSSVETTHWPPNYHLIETRSLYSRPQEESITTGTNIITVTDSTYLYNAKGFMFPSFVQTKQPAEVLHPLKHLVSRLQKPHRFRWHTMAGPKVCHLQQTTADYLYIVNIVSIISVVHYDLFQICWWVQCHVSNALHVTSPWSLNCSLQQAGHKTLHQTWYH